MGLTLFTCEYCHEANTTYDEYEVCCQCNDPYCSSHKCFLNRHKVEVDDTSFHTSCDCDAQPEESSDEEDEDNEEEDSQPEQKKSKPTPKMAVYHHVCDVCLGDSVRDDTLIKFLVQKCGYPNKAAAIDAAIQWQKESKKLPKSK